MPRRFRNNLKNKLGLQPRVFSAEKNLGCSRAVESALDWFFSHVDAGIVIEDDCLVDTSFFPYAADLLDRYRFEEEVSMVSGFTFAKTTATRTSYRFSRLCPVWGWATWAGSWERYSSSMEDWDPDLLMDKMKCYGSQAKKQFQIVENEYKSPETRTWGVQWRYRNLMDDKLSIITNSSLVQNVGFGHANATKQKEAHSISKQIPDNIEFPLRHPSRLVNDTTLDEHALELYYSEKERG